jgi:hypothetical protein
MGHLIVGPVLADVTRLSTGSHFVLASAFYSGPRLRATTITASSAELLVRLDLTKPDEWVTRAISPDGLLDLVDRHPDVDIGMYCGPHAHAKVYVGDDTFLVGSANYTMRGLAGTTNEVLWCDTSKGGMQSVRRALARYRKGLRPLSYAELKDYVERYFPIVKRLSRKAKTSPEDSPTFDAPRPRRLGAYEDFLRWLEKEGSTAAAEVLARARGKGNLSGHIRMNFYGIRQFLLGHPGVGRNLRRELPAAYRIAGDPALEQDLRYFVANEATNEGGLVVDTWRTYLPMRLGGKPKSGGGTQGNLNRMLPLMARYLRRVC